MRLKVEPQQTSCYDYDYDANAHSVYHWTDQSMYMHE